MKLKCQILGSQMHCGPNQIIEGHGSPPPPPLSHSHCFLNSSARNYTIQLQFDDALLQVGLVCFVFGWTPCIRYACMCVTC